MKWRSKCKKWLNVRTRYLFRVTWDSLALSSHLGALGVSWHFGGSSTNKESDWYEHELGVPRASLVRSFFKDNHMQNSFLTPEIVRLASCVCVLTRIATLCYLFQSSRLMFDTWENWRIGVWVFRAWSWGIVLQKDFNRLRDRQGCDDAKFIPCTMFAHCWLLLHSSLPYSSLLIAFRDRLDDCEARLVRTLAHTLDNPAQASSLLINFVLPELEFLPAILSVALTLFEPEESAALTVLRGMTLVPTALS